MKRNVVQRQHKHTAAYSARKPHTAKVPTTTLHDIVAARCSLSRDVSARRKWATKRVRTAALYAAAVSAHPDPMDPSAAADRGT